MGFQFDRNRHRVKQCPCGKSNSDGKFCPFKGHNQKGKCFSCDKTFWPDSDTPFIAPYKAKKKPLTSFIEKQTVVQSMHHKKGENLLSYLTHTFDEEPVYQAFKNYFVGLSKKWGGACVFWQIDNKGRVRTGKIMAFDSAGHRIKQPRSLVTWVHKELNLTNFNLEQCFFGEHLLKQFPNQPVAIVESEKTALICSICFPSFIWLATGGKVGCNFYTRSVNHVLQGRNVILFPDVGELDLWKTKAATIPAKSIHVSPYLESLSKDHPEIKGQDLADFLHLQDASNHNRA